MLTPKGKAYALLVEVRDRWNELSPSQREEAAELVDRLSKALRREEARPRPVKVPLVGRVTA